MITKQSLLQLLADNAMDSLFEELKSRQGHYEDLVLLESQWKDLQSRQRYGTISGEQANLEAARVRKGLLELIEISFATPRPHTTPVETMRKPPLPMKTIGWSALGLLVCLLVVRFFTLSGSSGEKEQQYPAADKSASPAGTQTATSAKRAATLDISVASPLMFAPGDFQYERVYKVVEGRVEHIGGGEQLVTLKVGLDFRGIINKLLSHNDFRLLADDLPGPVAPSNHMTALIESKSYGEGEVTFTIKDTVTRFSVVLEGKPEKRWEFTIR